MINRFLLLRSVGISGVIIAFAIVYALASARTLDYGLVFLGLLVSIFALWAWIRADSLRTVRKPEQ